MDITLLADAIPPGFKLYGLVINYACIASDYIDSLEEIDQKQVINLFNLITSNGLPKDKKKFRDVEDDIFELKTRRGVRILCFFGGGNLRYSLILTHGFHKANKKIFNRQKERALRWYKEFVEKADIRIIS